jgi:hypothetical protein
MAQALFNLLMRRIMVPPGVRFGEIAALASIPP